MVLLVGCAPSPGRSDSSTDAISTPLPATTEDTVLGLTATTPRDLRPRPHNPLPVPTEDPVFGAADARATPARRDNPACWAQVQVPVDVGILGLRAVVALPNHEAWAVGEHPVNGGSQPLILHLQDAHWDRVPQPFAGSLSGVTALAPDNVWAVGTADGTLVLHWDGTAWQRVPSPNPGGSGNALTAISAHTADDIWAVGMTVPTNSSEQPLLLHWDGRRWTEKPAAILPGNTIAQSVVAVDTADVWVTGVSNGSGLLILHWNGTRWTADPQFQVTVRLDGYNAGELRSVTALSPQDVWTVGYYRNYADQVRPLIAHWDGQSWTRVPSPNLGKGVPAAASSILSSVVAIAVDNLWAGGAWGTSETGDDAPLILHWDGSHWNVAVDTPPPGVTKASVGAVASQNDVVWTVGQFTRSPDESGGLVSTRQPVNLCK